MNNKKLQDSDQELDEGSQLTGYWHVEKQQPKFTAINAYKH